jgi:hypothetical protein
MKDLGDVELVARYYSGRRPGKISKNVREKYPTLLELFAKK